MLFADIILPLPIEGLFTYSVPDALCPMAQVGCRVLVSFGRSKKYVGLIAALHNRQPEGFQVKAIIRLIDSQPLVLDSQLRLWQWIADYYMSPIGEVYKAALPAGLKAEEGYTPKTDTFVRLTPPYRDSQAQHTAIDMLSQSRAYKQKEAFEAFLNAGADLSLIAFLNTSHASSATVRALVSRGLLETYEVEVGRLNHGGDPHPEHIKTLTTAQQDAYNKILLSMMRKQVTLLHGVTSSGKTEIYIHLIQREIDAGRQVLYLLPEIALTVQMMDRLRRVFGNRLGIYHSRYSDAERVEIWQKQLSANPYDVILGARSAVFLPFQRLGLVIVDEEHETSYKQQDPMPRYHARSVAIMLARKTIYSPPSQGGVGGGSPVLLGTATPAMETYHNARTGKYGLVELTVRHQDVALPEVQVVDIADLQHRKMMNGPFSPLLLARVREALERGEQALLFQNRRGYAPQIQCHQCGWVPHCQHCDVALTLHRQTAQLTCHYCGTTYQVPTECPACGSHQLNTRGYGTERLEDQLRDILPEARIARMDLDTTRSAYAYERLIGDFATGRTNLIIGTQMISKGLDFGRVTVVGIINADAMLNQPDFRAYEHAYMMMTQVSGRAGRRNKRGTVILQTHNPHLPVIQQIVNGDYAGLYNSLMAERQVFKYPPFFRLIYIYLKHRSDNLVDQAAHDLAARLRQGLGSRLLGPDKPAVAKVKALAIRKLVIKIEPQLQLADVRRFLQQQCRLLTDTKRYATLQVYYDVDPL